MKKFLCILLCCIIVSVTFASCEKGDGVPFLTTKSSTTTVKNTVTVTFPEGFTVLQIAQRLEENGVCSKDEFLKVCNEPYEGIEISNPDERVFLLEGYVFADTYEFYFNSDAKDVLKKFIDNFNKKITPEIKAKAESLGYTLDEMLTLASVIQMECDKDIAECANVSSVFHNRLKSPSFPKLQSDVTTFYITQKLGDYLGYAKDADGKALPLEEQSDEIRHYLDIYSTYYCNGLPAGPICNPSIKAVNAAVNPADTDYVYFLTDPSGENFYYASTLAQHNKNGKEAGLF
ncbi:MAG: endolytic transglycosylase MltG [Clostridia bacterium]|nr:endolytic transglycosylase MltG [Clostridia bacterium]